jgi:CIC family chloride channel protein
LAGYYPPLPAGESQLLYVPGGGSWLIVLVPAVGGLIAGLIIYRWAPEAEGHGTDAVISSFHRFGGVIRRRVPLVKTVASVLTIGSGGSAGREGPIAQIGAGFGSWLASALKVKDSDRRWMVVCGTAAGVGSIFKAPLGGAIFATEVLYRRDFEADALIPALVASVVSYSVFASFPNVGFNPIFAAPKYFFTNPTELIYYATLAIACGIIARFYIYIFYGLRDKAFKRLVIPRYFKPAIGGLALGVLALFIPEVLGTGYGWIQLAIYGKLAISTMTIILVAKIFATSFTISSGGSGGVFAPSMVIGGMLGGAFGQMFFMLSPTVEAGAFVLVGMAAFFAAAAKVPIAALVMVSEMSGDYHLLAPLMLACAISYIISGRSTIYESQVYTRAQSPAHRGEFNIDILEQMRVESVMTKDVLTINPETKVMEVSRLISQTGHLTYPVLKEGKLIGIVSYSDTLKVPREETAAVKVEEIMSTKVIVTYPNEVLDDALHKMDESGHGHLPVVHPDNPDQIMGILTKRDLIRGHEIAKQRWGIPSKHQIFEE